MQSILLVGVGGFFGALARFGVARLIHEWITHPFPVATLTINFLGSFALGCVYEFVGDDPRLAPLGLLLGIGFLGAFTTFSTFSFETLGLIKKGTWGLAALNILGSVLLCLIGVYFGEAAISRRPPSP